MGTRLLGWNLIFSVVWVSWALSWFLAALWSSRAQRRAPLLSQLAYRLPMGLGAVLIFNVGGLGQGWPLWRTGPPVNAALLVCVLVGLGFAWWARVHLGRLWSGSVTRKGDHRIVDTGPYGLVRHPIYSGLLLALGATAIARGTLAGLAGLVVIIAGIVIKARLEESFLRQELGPEAYDAYRRRVPMFVPFRRGQP